MKFTFTLLLLVTLFLSANSQQWKIITGYSLAVPRQEMGKNIQPAHSLQAGILHQLRGLKRLSLGAEVGLGSYASRRIDQTFQFSNNVASIVPVNYNSNVFNANLQARFDLLNSKKNYVVPYITAKGGLYNFFSNIHVDDPQSADGCTALQHENIINDKTLYWSAGGGLQIDPVIFAKRKRSGRVMIDISANTIHGGTMDYINTKHLVDANNVPTGGKPLNVKFINASTQEIHEHKVAQVYTSPLRMFEFRLGVTISLENY